VGVHGFPRTPDLCETMRNRCLDEGLLRFPNLVQKKNLECFLKDFVEDPLPGTYSSPGGDGVVGHPPRRPRRGVGREQSPSLEHFPLKIPRESSWENLLVDPASHGNFPGAPSRSRGNSGVRPGSPEDFQENCRGNLLVRIIVLPGYEESLKIKAPMALPRAGGRVTRGKRPRESTGGAMGRGGWIPPRQHRNSWIPSMRHRPSTMLDPRILFPGGAHAEAGSPPGNTGIPGSPPCDTDHRPCWIPVLAWGGGARRPPPQSSATLGGYSHSPEIPFLFHQDPIPRSSRGDWILGGISIP